ncbi:hypothetical protein [Saccharopolyspora taberi]|uniref:Uncharacterized protein n=1 Tax=Saccharopolyspora taberi TaxID=60895 RepID=A0ABN3VFW0_9PSEU
MSTLYEAILAVFLTGLTFIVLMRLPDFLDVLVERLRPREHAAVAGQAAAEDDQDDEKN